MPKKSTQETKSIYGFKINESIISMILGAFVVVLVAILAYSFFKSQRNVATVNPTPSVVTSPSAQATQSGSANQENNQSGKIAEPSAAAVALPMTHTVAAGESLWLIAQNYYHSGYNYVDIAKINGLSNPGQLIAGQKLTIPNVAPRQLTVGTVSPTITLSHIEGTSYIVQKGDNLWQIALRAYGDGYRWTDIARANKLANPSRIFSGNVLTIPR